MSADIAAKKNKTKRLPRWLRVATIVLAAILILSAAIYIVGSAIGRLTPYGTTVYGATFSKIYAQDLGLDWKAVYASMLDELDVRLVRVPAYWSAIEPQPGQYDFADIDWQIAEAAKREAKVILTMGMKAPRWPECYLPSWTQGMSPDEIHRRALDMVRAVVEHYKNEAIISDWQVENEPLLPFGMCPKPDYAFLKTEVDLVHSLDQRPVLMQDSGEASVWVPTAELADTLGVSLYRFVWYKKVGYIHWPAFASLYWFKAALARAHVDRVIITELQAEPWFTQPLTAVPIDEQLAQLDESVLRDNVAFAKLVGFPEVYFWGVEWWYWLKGQGHPELWDAAKEIIVAAHQGRTGLK